jgi:hypothetical protein
MRRFLLPVVFLLFAGAAFGGPCVPGSLADYLALPSGGCTNSFAFQDFQLGPAQAFATPIDPALIQVTPVLSPDGPFFDFTVNAAAGPGELLESFFRFTVTGSLRGAFIGLGNATVSGDGVVLGILDVCADGSFLGIEPIGCTGTPGSAIAFAISGDASPRANLSFSPPASFFDVFVDITIDGGLNGSASLQSAQAGTETPEPGAMALVALGLGVLGLIRKR